MNYIYTKYRRVGYSRLTSKERKYLPYVSYMGMIEDYTKGLRPTYYFVDMRGIVFAEMFFTGNGKEEPVLKTYPSGKIRTETTIVLTEMRKLLRRYTLRSFLEVKRKYGEVHYAK